MISTRNRSTRLRGIVIGGIGAIALLATSAPATSTATAAPASDERGVKCAKGESGAARMVKGSNYRKDPNSISTKKATSMNREFRSAVRLMRDGEGTPDNDNLFHIPVYIHIIKGKDGVGAVSRERIASQMGVLNNGFQGRVEANSQKTPFEFDLRAIDVTQNPAWYRHFPGSKAERKMKGTLRRGDAHALNVYLANPRPTGLLGYATFPQFYDNRPELDGVVVLNRSLPGGKIEGIGQVYSRGDTLTHEVGHWLGLYHTFQGRCGPRGDYVTDTPKEQSPNFGYCPAGTRDTCPAAGNDPVDNFMDYSYDACLDTFSKLQANRMRLAYKAFRR
ncbi:MAG: zinc metalloprotease [Nocardioidaceae bacterium]|nr:zinc metalloprotease [Nocardioidaceae bacterium]MBA3800613.1 zinc metalloprotease [Geodermatophilaceae bacterium]